MGVVGPDLGGADAGPVPEVASARYLPSLKCKHTTKAPIFAKSESPRMRIPPYFTDSEGNPFPVRSSWRTSSVDREEGSGDRGKGLTDEDQGEFTTRVPR